MRSILAKKTRWGISFFHRHPVVFSSLLATGMVLCVYIALGVWPFGEGTVITGDLNAQYIPYFSHYQRAFAGDAGFFYGFDKSLGGPLAALFAYYVASPLNVLYLLVPVSAFAALAGFLFAVKVVLAASSMALFLHKKFPSLGLLGAVPALGYAFSAYIFVYAQNIMWHDVLVLLPLVCLALDRLLCGRGYLRYSALLALMIWANFYIAYMACLFLVLYVVLSFVIQRLKKDVLLRSSLRFAGASVLGAGLAGVLLVPTVLNLSGSKGVGTEYAFSLETQFPLWSLPEKLAFNNFQWVDVIDGQPLLYCGLVLPLLALCFFVSRAIKLRMKVCAGIALLVLIGSFWIEGLDQIWHGFAEPVWFFYRYSWLFCFVLAILAAAALASGAVTKRTLAVSAGVLAFVFLALAPVSQTAGTTKLVLSAVAVVGYAVLLWLYATGKTVPIKQLASGAIVLAICAELSLSGVLISRKFEPYPLQTYETFVNDVGGVMHAAQEENEQYRVEKNFYRTLNDTMLLDYHGVSHFGSTQDSTSTDTLWNLGYRGNGSYLYGSTAFSDGVLGIHTLLSNGERAVPSHWLQTEQTAVGTLYENPYALPMLFTVPQGDVQTELEQWQDSFAFQNELYRFLTAQEEPLLQQVEQVQREQNGQVLEGLAGAHPSGAEYVVQAESAGYYYALAVSDTPYADLPLQINDEVVGKVFTADQNGVINLGYYEVGETFSFGFVQNGVDLALSDMYVAYLPSEALETLVQEVAENSGQFLVEDGAVNGTITAQAGRETLFMSIPYDDGWRAWVNGQEVQPTAVLGGFMAVPLAEGENEVRVMYEAPGLGLGFAVSAASLVVFCLLLMFAVYRKRKDEIKAYGENDVAENDIGK